MPITNSIIPSPQTRIKNPKQFKHALAIYQEKHPDVDIFSKDLPIIAPIIPYLLYGIGLLGTNIFGF